MSDPVDWGGFAFPVGKHSREDFRGMTLRDWFAGQALAGMTGGGWRPGSDEARETLARDAYKVADAMLKARGGK